MKNKYLHQELEKLKLPESGLKEILENSDGLLPKILGLQRTTIIAAKQLQKEKTYGYIAYDKIMSSLEKYNELLSTPRNFP